jgi:hypothetical protein
MEHLAVSADPADGITGHLNLIRLNRSRRRRKALNSKSEIDQRFVAPLLAIVALFGSEEAWQTTALHRRFASLKCR